MTPDDRKYTPTDEWIQINGGIATVGISDHAQEHLGDITFVELPATGAVVKAGQACMVVESVKAASDVYAPISGTVLEVNAALGDDPGLVNRDPYGGGWLYRLGDVDAGELAALLDAAAYQLRAGG